MVCQRWRRWDLVLTWWEDRPASEERDLGKEWGDKQWVSSPECEHCPKLQCGGTGVASLLCHRTIPSLPHLPGATCQEEPSPKEIMSVSEHVCQALKWRCSFVLLNSPFSISPSYLENYSSFLWLYLSCIFHCAQSCLDGSSSAMCVIPFCRQNNLSSLSATFPACAVQGFHHWIIKFQLFSR